MVKKSIGQTARETFSMIDATHKATLTLKRRHRKEYTELLDKEYKKSMKTWDED